MITVTLKISTATSAPAIAEPPSDTPAWIEKHQHDSAVRADIDKRNGVAHYCATAKSQESA
jgi:hypothetical protein